MPRISFKPKITIPPQTFPQRINVARAVQTLQDGSGGRVVTPPDKSPVIYANVPASIQNVGAKEMNVQGRLVNVIQHDVFTPTKMSLMNGDYVIFGERILILQTFKDASQLGALFILGCVEYMTVPLA